MNTVKSINPVTLVLGILLVLFGLWSLLLMHTWIGGMPAAIGASLIYLGLRPGRKATVIFGHIMVVCGCLLVTWGIYLLPVSKPVLAHIIFRPLFWGLISIFGGICAIYHGFCRCVMKSGTPS